MKKAIVLHTHVAGLGVIRSLGRMGVPVIAMHYEEKEMGHLSKHVVQRIRVPHPGYQERDFIDCLIEHGHVFANSILIPTNDHTVSAVSRNKEVLGKYYIVAVPEWDIVRNIIIKKHTYEIAKSLGIPHPKTFVPRAIDEIAEIGSQLGFPCLVKPCEGHKFFEVFGTKMFRVDCLEELRERFSQSVELGLEVMVQELIPGDDTSGINYNSYFVEGSPIAEFTARKARLDPPRFGSPRVLMSQRIPEIIETGREVIGALGVYGFSCTEFKRDVRDGVYKLMEVNIRHNLTSSLAVKCGMNFPSIMYEHLCNDRLNSVNGFEPNVYWIDLLKDIEHSLLSRKYENFSVREYVRPYTKKKVFAVLSFADPLPFVKRTMYVVSLGFRSLIGKPLRMRHGASRI